MKNIDKSKKGMGLELAFKESEEQKAKGEIEGWSFVQK